MTGYVKNQVQEDKNISKHYLLDEKEKEMLKRKVMGLAACDNI